MGDLSIHIRPVGNLNNYITHPTTNQLTFDIEDGSTLEFLSNSLRRKRDSLVRLRRAKNGRRTACSNIRRAARPDGRLIPPGRLSSIGRKRAGKPRCDRKAQQSLWTDLKPFVPFRDAN